MPKRKKIVKGSSGEGKPGKRIDVKKLKNLQMGQDTEPEVLQEKEREGSYTLT